MSTLVEPVLVKRARLESVDVLRGVVMILMAIDHSRDFFGTPAVNPTNLDVTTVPQFFPRWILCAPTFFPLTGTGAWLCDGESRLLSCRDFCSRAACG
jgi:uncharacterized membrane protein